MVAVRNRVFLGSVDYAFVTHTKLSFFVASSFEGDVLFGSTIHRPDGDFLLAFALFLHGVEEVPFCPGWDGFVSIGNFSAEEECPKGWQVTPLWIFVVRPVCRSDLAFQEYLLRGVDCRSMTKCPGVIVLVAKGRWHLESTDVW